MIYSVYILKSNKNNSYYIGSSGNVAKRIALHNRGMVKSTKRYLPWTIVYQERFNNLSLARKKESQLKSLKKRKPIENLIKSGDPRQFWWTWAYSITAVHCIRIAVMAVRFCLGPPKLSGHCGDGSPILPKSTI